MSTELAVSSVEEAWRNSSFATSIQKFLDLQERALKTIPQGATETNDINDPDGYVKVSSGKHKITVKEHIRRIHTEAFNTSIWTVARDSLNADPDIKQSSEELGIESFRRIVETPQGDLEFDLLADRVDSWKERHAKDISSRFTHAKSDYTYTRRSKAGQVRVFYDCHHRGEKQVHKFRVPGGKTGKSRKRGESIKCGCPAKYSAVRKTMRSVAGPAVEVCHIVYNYRHNHTVGEREDVATLLKSEAIKARIRGLLNRSPDLQATMRRILLSYCDFFTLPHADAKSQDNLISYNDVYQLWYDICMDGAQKYPDEKVSAKMWMDDLTKENYFTCCTVYDGLYYAFSSKWQLEQLKAHGSTLYFDGLHRIARYWIRDGETENGIPVAFMVTKAMDLPLSQWLTYLKEKLLQEYQFNLNPTTIVTDQSFEEITTLKAAFPSAQVLFCPWQALKDWERSVPIYISTSSGIAQAERPGLIAKALTELIAIAYETSQLEAMAKVADFRQSWGTTCPELLEYLNENYLIESTMLKWMLCIRPNALPSRSKADRHVVKTWHHQTKMGIFTYHRNQQSDWMIAFLDRIVIPYYQHRATYVENVESGEKNPVPNTTSAESDHAVSPEDVATAAAAAAAAVAATTAVSAHESSSTSSPVEPHHLPASLPPQVDTSALIQAAVQEAVAMNSAAMASRQAAMASLPEEPASNSTTDPSENMSSEDRIGRLMTSIIELCGRRDINVLESAVVSSTATPCSQPGETGETEAVISAASTSSTIPTQHQEDETPSEPVSASNDDHDVNSNQEGDSEASDGASGANGSGGDGGASTESDSVGFYANRLAELYTSRNVSNDFPQRKEVEQALKRCYELCAKYLAMDSSAGDPKAKRPRQQE
ncbi:Calcium-responsive transcription factor [Actinomortierella ambigua]|nr:Calcium-responsive transcription factor [Actinomortierella ambigua]